MQLLFLYGPPGVGKLTVARELGARTGFPVFHNHLVIDALLAVFPFGSAPFVELRERIWLDIMGEAATSGTPGLIFTFAPEDTVRPGFPDRLVERLAPTGSTVHFVQLTAPEDMIEQRIESPSRREFNKLWSAGRYRELRDSGAHTYPPLPADLTLDTSLLTASEAADAIVKALHLS